MENLVSVILPSYNHSLYLKERLTSIFNQTYQNYEVIILDDASTDDSLSILDSYRNHPKVSHFIVNTENSGSPFKQWKKGLELAQGDYMWIAESDDRCELNFLEMQLQHLKNCDMSVAKTIVFNGELVGKELSHPAFIKGDEAILNKELIWYCPVLNVSSALFQKIDNQKLHDSKFADFRIIGDRVFYHEFFHGKKLVFNDSTLSYFRQELKNLSNLGSKTLKYLSEYFWEHIEFINLASKKDNALQKARKPYIHRFFKRVRDRVSRKDKLSVAYFKLYLYYRFQLLKSN
ncbi:glycosyltransferase family 2 protein [Aequorivita vladivostokensis]|uniref:glycosyltransferase family 2 protein n=1 Tax=Aequorivita vladivostokensis TaxID=171194 RepID=UPI00069764CD|nr:glycosyltransferase family 2 protein [Aequorivita vladivostokensis]